MDHAKMASKQESMKMANQTIEKLDMESIQKTFEGDMYKIAHDTSCFAKYVEDVGQCKRAAQLARIYHVRAENQRGSRAVLENLEWHHKHEVGLLTDNDVLEMIKKASFRNINPFRSNLKSLVGKP